MTTLINIGNNIRVNPKFISYFEGLEIVLANKHRYTVTADVIELVKAYVENRNTGTFHYKGKVSSVSNLPSTGNIDGDMYLVTGEDKYYAWNGTSWDDTPTIVNISTLETAIAAEATRATGKEQELDAKINAKTSDITVSQLAESTKQYIEASGGGTITNMPDEEDLTVENNALKLKNRVGNAYENGVVYSRTTLGFHFADNIDFVILDSLLWSNITDSGTLEGIADQFILNNNDKKIYAKKGSLYYSSWGTGNRLAYSDIYENGALKVGLHLKHTGSSGKTFYYIVDSNGLSGELVFGSTRIPVAERSDYNKLSVDNSFAGAKVSVRRNYDNRGLETVVPSCTLDLAEGSVLNANLKCTTGMLTILAHNDFSKLLGTTFNMSALNIVSDYFVMPLSETATDNSSAFMRFFEELNRMYVFFRNKQNPPTIVVPYGTYKFTHPVEVPFAEYYFREITIRLDGNLVFDYSDTYTFPSLQEIKDGAPQLTLTSVSLYSYNVVNINLFGRGDIDAGWTTINGDWYDMYVSDGVRYSNAYHWGLQVTSTKANNNRYKGRVSIKGITLHNAGAGIGASAGSVEIEDVEVYDVYFDNGIDATTQYSDTIKKGTLKISRCYAHEVADLGIKAGGDNVIVENCLAENCGVDQRGIAFEEQGKNKSINCGGGFGIEGFDTTSVEQTLIIGCKAKNCYNYGFCSNRRGTSFVSCKAEGIVSTYVEGEQSRSRWGHKGNGFFFNSDGNSGTAAINACSLVNCIVTNTPFAVSGMMGSNFTTFLFVSGCSFYGIGGDDDNQKEAGIVFNQCFFPDDYTPKGTYKYTNCYLQDGTEIVL